MRLFLLTLMVLMGCMNDEKPTSRLNISFNTHPNTSDPRMAADFVSSTLVCMIYEGLTRCTSGSGVEPALAKKVEISNDQTIYTFHLKNAYWSNGEPITAFDFERSWKQIIYPPKPCAFLFYPIKNAEKCSRGEISIDSVGVHALNDQTLLVELERPTPYFYSLTAFPSFLAAPSYENTFSGPFRIEKSIHNSEILLTKNPTFWNEKQIHLDEIYISIIPDEMTALQMFERGDLDWIGGSLSPLPPDAIEKLQSRIESVPSAGSTLCIFNINRFPFQNCHLRKAFSYAIDRQEIVEKITQGSQTPANSILPPCFSKQNFGLFDPERAKIYFQKGLEELGIQAKELESLTLYFKLNQIDKRLAQTLQKQWNELFGITIQLAQLDFKSHTQKLHVKDYQITLASWIAQFDDPVSLLDRFKYKEHLKNYPGWENDTFLYYLVNACTSKKRDELLEKAEKILADELPLTPIYHWNSPALRSPRIAKIGLSPCGGILFERFELAQ